MSYTLREERQKHPVKFNKETVLVELFFSFFLSFSIYFPMLPYVNVPLSDTHCMLSIFILQSQVLANEYSRTGQIYE